MPAETGLTPKVLNIVAKHIARAQKKKCSDTVMLRSMINEARLKGRKVKLAKIKQDQFRKIIMKYRRNAPKNRKGAINAAVKSGLRKTRS
jgi:hypothetical protein